MLLSDEIATALRSHFRRVSRPCWNIAAIPHAKRLSLPAHRQGHLTFENDVRSETGVRVIGIGRLRPIPPNERVRESLGSQHFPQFAFGVRWRHVPGESITGASAYGAGGSARERGVCGNPAREHFFFGVRSIFWRCCLAGPVSCYGRRRLSPAAPDTSLSALLHRVIGRHLKQRRVWFLPLNIRQLEGRRTHARIAALDHDDGLQFR